MNNNNLYMYINNIPDDSKLIYAVEILRQKIRKKLDEFFSNIGIDVFKFNFLMILKNAKSEFGVKEQDVQESLLVVPEYIDKMQEELILSGLISVNIIETGEKYIKITDNGLNLIDNIYDDYQKFNSKISNRISKEDKDILREKMLEWFVSIE